MGDVTKKPHLFKLCQSWFLLNCNGRSEHWHTTWPQGPCYLITNLYLKSWGLLMHTVLTLKTFILHPKTEKIAKQNRCCNFLRASPNFPNICSRYFLWNLSLPSSPMSPFLHFSFSLFFYLTSPCLLRKTQNLFWFNRNTTGLHLSVFHYLVLYQITLLKTHSTSLDRHDSGCLKCIRK